MNNKDSADKWYNRATELEDERERSTILNFCNDVDTRAQELMLQDGKVSGKHYAAMRLIFKERFGETWK